MTLETMSAFDMLVLFLIDFYKVGHVSQYPKGTKQVWVNWTPRSTRVPGQEDVVSFGAQYFIKEILLKAFNETFFKMPLSEVLSLYRTVISATLGDPNPRTDHIEALWNCGHLPIKIYAIPEGHSTPLNIPAMVMTNTVDHAFWLPNYLETILSNIMWKCCTSATTAQKSRSIFMKYAKEAGETDFSFVDWQGHDFSFRGMSGREDAILSGMGHLLSFKGTDTIPAIIAMHNYYGAPLTCGGSVPATEHSVMCAGTKDGEYETIHRLITDVYPKGVVSVVSDTWDLWKVLTEYVPALKEDILARDGKTVFRPDSGRPADILCGDKNASMGSPEADGVLKILAYVLGVDFDRGEGKLPIIRKAGAIYGEGINHVVQDEILHRTVHDLKLSPYNIVMGFGSYTYEYVTRDTFGFAIKATAVRTADEKVVDIFKDPITDNGLKKSHRGIPAVYLGDDGKYFCVQGSTPESLDACGFKKVFENSELLIEQSYEEIKKRVRHE